MKIFTELGQWISETLLGPSLQVLFAGQLELLGVGASAAVLIASILSVLVARLAWKLIEPTPPIDWSAVDISNPAKLQATFDDFHILVTASRDLSENVATTVEAFADQVTRLQVAQSLTHWDKVRTDDDDLMQKLYYRKDLVQHIATLSGSSPARDLDEFRTQFLIVQQSKRTHA